jgi:hypothetical protein
LVVLEATRERSSGSPDSGRKGMSEQVIYITGLGGVGNQPRMNTDNG